MEDKGVIMRYRSRYTQNEILSIVGDILAEHPDFRFHYLFLGGRDSKTE